MDIDYASMGLRIRHIRVQKSLTQDELSEQSGTSRSFINRVENGKKGLSLETLIAIANALNVSTDDILVDSLVHPHSEQDTDAHYLLLDCSEEETHILIKAMTALKSIIKPYNIT